MNVTLSVIKADVGSIGGHTKPTPTMLDATKKMSLKPLKTIYSLMVSLYTRMTTLPLSCPILKEMITLKFIPFVKAHYVGGDARGSHNMPLMPVPINAPVIGPYCLPIVSCLGFSLTPDAHFSDFYTEKKASFTQNQLQPCSIF